jgi:hypothetical protein
MRKTIALDANLLVLLVVGLAEPRYIPLHKRLKAFTVDDFKLLTNMIAASAGMAVTPNALSEASNLLRQINEPAKTRVGMALRRLIQNTNEIYVASVDASSRREFLRIGLSDSALLEVNKNDIVVLSVDLGLCLAAQAAGYTAVNFNHVREGLHE